MIKFKHSMCLSFGGTGAACPCRTGTCLCRFRKLPGTARQKKMLNLVLLRNYGHSIPPTRFSTVRKLVPNSLKNMLNTNSFFFLYNKLYLNS